MIHKTVSLLHLFYCFLVYKFLGWVGKKKRRNDASRGNFGTDATPYILHYKSENFEAIPSCWEYIAATIEGK